MSLTGLIYGGIVVLWLCYLVPLALRRYDEAARARSVERFSTAMRVLGRAEPGEPGKPLAPRVGGPAARTAARRRRRVLGVLLVLTAGTTLSCAYGLLAWWTVSVPAGLVACFLVVARVQVARTRRRRERAPARQDRVVAEPVPEVVEPATAATHESPAEVPDPVEPEPVATTGGGSLWDPLPVTLPTYVSKPRATRTVRTVDLAGPGVWSSGRLGTGGDQPRESPEPAAKAGAEAGPKVGEADRARAVGD